MKSIVFLVFLASLSTLPVTGQKLSIEDLTKLIGLSLNDAETILSDKKFEFKATESNEKGKLYTFAFNLDDYGKYGDEYLMLFFYEGKKSSNAYYQLEKKDWQKLKNDMTSLGYNKDKTETNPDGSLCITYSNSQYIIMYTTAKGYQGTNNGRLIYTLNVAALNVAAF